MVIVGAILLAVVVRSGMQGRPIKMRVTFVDSENKGVAVHDDLDVVGVVEFAFFIDDDEGDVVPTSVSSEVLRDFVGGAVRRNLVGPDVVVVKGLACCGGNVRRLDSLDGGECDVFMLDGIPSEWARCVWMCGNVAFLGFQIGEGVVLAVDGSGVRGLLILRGGDEERLRAIVGEGLQPVVMSRGSVCSIPNHLSQRHFS